MTVFYKESKSQKKIIWRRGDERKEIKKGRWGRDGARVSIFFTKNAIFFRVGGVQLVNFFTKNPNLKKVEGGT